MNFNQITLFEHPKSPGYFLTEKDLALETKINLIYLKLEFLEQQSLIGWPTICWPAGLCFLVLETTDLKEELHPTYRVSLLQALLADYNLVVDYLPQMRWRQPETTGSLGQKITGLATKAFGDYVVYGSVSLNTVLETDVLSQVFQLLPEIGLSPTFVIWAEQIVELDSSRESQKT